MYIFFIIEFIVITLTCVMLEYTQPGVGLGVVGIFAFTFLLISIYYLKDGKEDKNDA